MLNIGSSLLNEELPYSLDRFSTQKVYTDLVEAQEETMVENIAYNDPAIKASAGFRFEIYPFIDPVLRE